MRAFRVAFPAPWLMRPSHVLSPLTRLVQITNTDIFMGHILIGSEFNGTENRPLTAAGRYIFKYVNNKHCVSKCPQICNSITSNQSWLYQSSAAKETFLVTPYTHKNGGPSGWSARFRCPGPVGTTFFQLCNVVNVNKCKIKWHQMSHLLSENTYICSKIYHLK